MSGAADSDTELDLAFRMHAERTPNPNSIKWVLGRAIVDPGVTAHFDSPPSEDVSPLASRLFAIDGVIGVFLASNFTTVTKRDGIEWTDIAEPIVAAIKACVGAGGAALGPAFEFEEATAEADVVARIRRVLDDEIRPVVAMDGGDIVFAGFRDGIVELYMQGSCSGCPSSTATLKYGIETRLRELIPEVAGVVAL
ncbi:MAG TPA: NifU family protein [Myxococcota bacterium]